MRRVLKRAASPIPEVPRIPVGFGEDQRLPDALGPLLPELKGDIVRNVIRRVRNTRHRICPHATRRLRQGLHHNLQLVCGLAPLPGRRQPHPVGSGLLEGMRRVLLPRSRIVPEVPQVGHLAQIRPLRPHRAFKRDCQRRGPLQHIRVYRHDRLIRLRAHKLLARVQMERGDLEEATGNLEELHVLVPDDLEILMNLGVCYERGDRADAAMDMYRQAVAASPEAALPHLRIGLLHWKEGRAAEAISTYRHALELAPDSIEATNNLAMLLLDANGDRQEALALARRAAEAAPNSMSILDTLGWALCQDGQYDQAVGLLVRTTKGQPDNPTPFYHLAVALRGAGKLAEARSALQKALAISPQFEKADDARRLMAEVSAALRGE